MEDTSRTSAAWHLRMFSYLLIICGIAGLAVGIAVGWSAVTQTASSPAAAPLASAMLALAALVTNTLTIIVGVWGLAASRHRERLGTFRTLALVDIVATVLGLGLCYALGAGMPTSLLFNVLLMAICVVIGNNLLKSQN